MASVTDHIFIAPINYIFHLRDMMHFLPILKQIIHILNTKVFLSRIKIQRKKCNTSNTSSTAAKLSR